MDIISCVLQFHMIKKQPAYEDDERSIVYRIIPKNVTIKALEALGASLNFIEIWLKLLDQNYEAIYGMYNKAMNEMYKKIPTTMTKPLSPRKKVQKLMKEIGGVWYMKNIIKGLTTLRRPKVSKK